MKTCAACKEVKADTTFYEGRNGRLSGYCKPCNAKRGKERRERDPEKTRQDRQEEYLKRKQKDPEKVKRASRDGYLRNGPYRSPKLRDYREELRSALRHAGIRQCSNCRRIQPIESFYTNGKRGLYHWCIECCKTRKHSPGWASGYQRRRRKQDPEYRIAGVLRCRFRQGLSRAKVKKSSRSLAMVGCDMSFLRAWLEFDWQDTWRWKKSPAPTWENYGEVWEIDHIRPVASYDLADPEQQNQCFHFTNLQALSVEDNAWKSDKIIPVLLEC